MIVYNITTKVNLNIAEKWLAWQKQEHIPEIMATQLFDDFASYRLLEQDDTEGPTFTMQYFTSSVEKYHRYMEVFAEVLHRKTVAIWGDNVIAFHSMMESV